MKVGDKWVNGRDIATVFKYNSNNYTLTNGNAYWLFTFSLEKLEKQAINNGWKPYNPEPEIKVGDVFKNKFCSIVIITCGGAYKYCAQNKDPDSDSRFNTSFYSTNLNSMYKKLIESGFTKVVKEEAQIKIGDKFINNLDQIVYVHDFGNGSPGTMWEISGNMHLGPCVSYNDNINELLTNLKRYGFRKLEENMETKIEINSLTETKSFVRGKYYEDINTKDVYQKTENGFCNVKTGMYRRHTNDALVLFKGEIKITQ